MTVPGSPYNFTQSFLTIKREEVFGLTAANGAAGQFSCCLSGCLEPVLANRIALRS
jgi:hypothetical protein